jgi:hypothetical protein
MIRYLVELKTGLPQITQIYADFFGMIPKLQSVEICEICGRLFYFVPILMLGIIPTDGHPSVGWLLASISVY